MFGLQMEGCFDVAGVVSPVGGFLELLPGAANWVGDVVGPGKPKGRTELPERCARLATTQLFGYFDSRMLVAFDFFGSTNAFSAWMSSRSIREVASLRPSLTENQWKVENLTRSYETRSSPLLILPGLR